MRWSCSQALIATVALELIRDGKSFSQLSHNKSTAFLDRRR
jgi:hypothetical protein